MLLILLLFLLTIPIGAQPLSKSVQAFKLPGVEACSVPAQNAWYIGMSTGRKEIRMGDRDNWPDYHTAAQMCGDIGGSLPVFADSCEGNKYRSLFLMSILFTNEDTWLGYVRELGTFVFDATSYLHLTGDYPDLNVIHPALDDTGGTGCIRYAVDQGIANDKGCANTQNTVLCRIEDEQACIAPLYADMTPATTTTISWDSKEYILMFEGDQANTIPALQAGLTMVRCRRQNDPVLLYINGIRDDSAAPITPLQCVNGNWQRGGADFDFACLPACTVPSQPNANLVNATIAVGDVIEANSTVQYACVTGYALDAASNDYVTCSVDGNIVGSVRCNAIPQCPTNSVINATLTDGVPPIYSPALLNYTCDSGHIFASGSVQNSFNCDETGTIVGLEHCVEIKECLTNTISNAQLTEVHINPIVAPALLNFTCNTGYAFPGETTEKSFSCLADGTTDSPVDCNLVCRTDGIANAALTNPSDAFRLPPATIEFTCSSDFAFSSTSLVQSFTCQVDGSLTSPVDCQEACLRPVAPATLSDADATSPDQYYFVGQSLTVGCQPFFTRLESEVQALEQSITITCESGETWSPPIECAQLCSSLDTAYLHDPERSYLLYYDSLPAAEQGAVALEESTKYIATSIAKVKCGLPDYEFADELKTTSECVAGNWTVPPNELTFCRPKFPMNAAEAAAAKAAQVLGCSYVLTVLGFSLATYFLFRQFELGRTLQFMEEVSLFIAHVLILTLRDFSGQAPQPGSHALCTTVGLGLQYFFCVHFTFLLLEALHVYTSLTNVNSTNSYFTLPVNLLLGWLTPLAPVLFCAAISLEPYYSTWSCWLNYDSKFALCVMFPYIALACGSFLLGEGAGIDEQGKANLPTSKKKRIIWARFSRVGSSIIVPISAAAYFVGSYTVYKQRVELFAVVLALNISVGILMWKFHAMSDAKARKLVRNAVNKCRSLVGKK